LTVPTDQKYTNPPLEIEDYELQQDFKWEAQPESLEKEVDLVRRMGGKRVLRQWLVRVFSTVPHYAYVEPFGGSLKVLCAKPKRSKVEIVNDIDADMIHFFHWIRYAPDDFCDRVNSLPCHEALNLGARYLLRARAQDPSAVTGLNRAVAWWLAYQSGFNTMGMLSHRYGSSVQSGLDTRVDRNRLQAFASRILGVDIRSTDYRRVIARANKRLDPSSYPPGKVLFYLDPPYDQTEGYESAAGKSVFGWKEQCELADLCRDIHEAGNLFLQTNSNTQRLHKLYSSYVDTSQKPLFKFLKREVYYSVSGTKEAREDTEELIISNFNPFERQQTLL